MPGGPASRERAPQGPAARRRARAEGESAPAAARPVDAPRLHEPRLHEPRLKEPRLKEPRLPDGALRILGPDGTAQGKEPGVALEILCRMYGTMTLCRLFDRKMVNLQRQGRVRFFGTSIGEEAAVVGSAAALEATDWIFPALRQLGALLWRGYPLWKAFAQNMGNEKDLLRGRQMPCHYSDREVRAVSWSSCIATQLTHAVGAAAAAKRKKTGEIVLAYLGDGATSENDFHAALTFAGVWKSPCVFLCQNNQWAISVPRAIQTASRTLGRKGAAYGIAWKVVDGNDILAVYEAVSEAARRARDGGGATLVEAVTYRIEGHSSSDDPTKYREAEEVASWKSLDPIDRFGRYLRGKGWWDDRRQAELQERLSRDLDASVKEAEAAGAPDAVTLFEDVFAAVPPFLEEQRGALQEERAGRKGHAGGVGEFPL